MPFSDSTPNIIKTPSCCSVWDLSLSQEREEEEREERRERIHTSIWRREKLSGRKWIRTFLFLFFFLSLSIIGRQSWVIGVSIARNNFRLMRHQKRGQMKGEVGFFQTSNEMFFPFLFLSPSRVKLKGRGSSVLHEGDNNFSFLYQ